MESRRHCRALTAAIESGESLTPDAKRPVTPEPPCSDAQSQQRNNADTDYQHRKSDRIVIEPMPALHTHDASPYQPATLCRSSPGRRSRGGFHLFSRERVAAGQDYEVRYEAKKTGKSKGEVKRAIKRAGPSRRNERW